MTRRNGPSAVAVALLTATAICAGGAVHADIKKGGTPVKNPVHPVHGPGSSHNPIVRHPVHGAGSSHNPIVVPPDCNDPNTLCRRP
jgi:hypothetical protein